jgi:hypothetical protein
VTKRILCALLLALVVGVTTRQVGAAPPGAAYRAAVVVGANAAAPGRQALRYGHADAQSVARVLTQLAGFAPGEVALLQDPDPAAVVKALEERLAKAGTARGSSLVLFYYSGHADTQALYPRGKPLMLTKIRELLDDGRATVRVGIVDACRGGGWTGTKGLTEAEVFEVNLPIRLGNEGSVFIASSSGLEDAHESEALGGSYFTHHWNAGLRGTADRNGDAVVTLTEAFEYAKSLTIRDTALVSKTPQHPSYHMNLRGRQDLPIARLSASKTAVSFEQSQGPTQLVHLETGLIVLEVPAGAKRLKLVVPPGRYLVRRWAKDGMRAREIAVAANTVTPVREQELELVGRTNIAIKHAEPRPITRSTVPDGMWDIEFAAGVAHESPAGGVTLGNNGAEREESEFATSFTVVHGFSDRVQWLVPTLALAYRGGEHGEFEWILGGGMIGWSVGKSAMSGWILTAMLGARLDLRFWFSPRSSLEVGAGVLSGMYWESDGEKRSAAPETWTGHLPVTTTHTLADTVTLSIGAAYGQALLFGGELPPADDFDPRLVVGSVGLIGFRPMPLVRIHLSDVVSLDGHARVAFDLQGESRVRETYMLGASFIW